MKLLIKHTKIIIAILSLIILKNMIVTAEESCTIMLDNVKKTVVVEGEMGDKANVLTTFTLLSDDTDITKLNDEVPPIAFLTALTQSGGKYYCMFSLPDNLESGKYYMYIANDSGSTENYFLYSSDKDVSNVVKLINMETSASSIENILNKYYKQLAVEEETMRKNSPVVAEILLSHRPQNGYSQNEEDAGEFLSELNKCMAGAMFINGEKSLDVITKYASDIGITKEEYEGYGTDVCSEFEKLIKNTDFKNNEISEVINQTRVLAFYKASKSWSETKENILGQDANGKEYIDNFKILNADKTYYDKIFNINGVYQKLFANLNNINEFFDLKKKFYDYSMEIYSSENSAPQGGGSNGGGGSSGGSSTQKYFSVDENDKVTEEISESDFADVKNHWAAEYISKLVSAGVINGFEDKTFRPENNITRAEFIKLIITAFNIEGSTENENFNDVFFDDWFYKYVNIAVDKKIVNGVTESLFKPNDNITRQDACVIIHRYLNEGENNILAQYNDYDEISDYAKNAVSSLTSIGLVSGIGDGIFSPKSLMTRAQAATLIFKAMGYCDKWGK